MRRTPRASRDFSRNCAGCCERTITVCVPSRPTWLDPAVHRGQPAKPPVRTGRGGGEPLSLTACCRAPRFGGHAEPSAGGVVVPLPAGAGHQAAVAGRPDPRQADGARADGTVARGGTAFTGACRRQRQARYPSTSVSDGKSPAAFASREPRVFLRREGDTPHAQVALPARSYRFVNIHFRHNC